MGSRFLLLLAPVARRSKTISRRDDRDIVLSFNWIASGIHFLKHATICLWVDHLVPGPRSPFPFPKVLPSTPDRVIILSMVKLAICDPGA